MDKQNFLGMHYFTTHNVDFDPIEIAEITWNRTPSLINKQPVYVQGLWMDCSKTPPLLTLICFGREDPIGTKMSREIIPVEAITEYTVLQSVEKNRRL